MQYWPHCVLKRQLDSNYRGYESHKVIFCNAYVCNTTHCFIQKNFGQLPHYQAVRCNAQTKRKIATVQWIILLKKRNRRWRACCTERQCSTYPESNCFLGTPSIVSPWPWLTLNFCPKEPLHNTTQIKTIKLLDAIWNRLRSKTTIKHFTWYTRAENFPVCTKRQGTVNHSLSPEACCPNDKDV